MATNQPTPTQKPTTLAGAMRWLGGIVGFLWGGSTGSADPEIGFWVGAIVGAAMGAVLGWATSLAVRVAYHVGFMALSLLLLAGWVYRVFNLGSGS